MAKFGEADDAETARVEKSAELDTCTAYEAASADWFQIKVRVSGTNGAPLTGVQGVGAVSSVESFVGDEHPKSIKQTSPAVKETILLRFSIATPLYNCV